MKETLRRARSDGGELALERRASSREHARAATNQIVSSHGVPAFSETIKLQ